MNRFLCYMSSLRSHFVISNQEFRKDWLSILMIVTSSRSSINIRHLEKATVSTGKEGLLSEGNAAYNWSRCSFFELFFFCLSDGFHSPLLKLFNVILRINILLLWSKNENLKLKVYRWILEVIFELLPIICF